MQENNTIKGECKTNRYFGLDISKNNIGLAISDDKFLIASPLTTIARNNLNQDIKTILQYCVTKNIIKIVIGWPLELNGTIGSSCKEIEKFVKKIKQNKLYNNIPIIFWDERFSTSVVERYLVKQADLSRKKRKKIIDSCAATYMLQGFLNYNKNINTKNK